MKRYILIACVDREIEMVGNYATRDEAYQTMLIKLESLINKVIMPNKDGFIAGANWHIDCAEACVNHPIDGDGDLYDWKILEVEV